VPEGRAFLALLACAREGLSARAFAEYLSLGVAPAPAVAAPAAREPGMPPRATPGRPSPRRWEQLLVDAAVIGGRARWERRLRGLIAELEAERATLTEEPARAERLAGTLAQLEGLLAFALPLLERLERLPHGGTWAAWLEALDQLARASLAEPDAVCAVLLELAPLAAVGPVELWDVERILGRRLGNAIVKSGGYGAGKVFVGSFEELPGRAFDVVFVLGLAEKVFPPRIVEDPLLPDARRQALGVTLISTDERAARERLYLRLAVGAARERLVLSFSRFDVEHGRPRVPSFYGLEVLHAAFGSLPAFDELTRRADPGAAARMGWPAPETTEQAIDDAEYDLAVLDQWRARAGKRRGGARYSLLANPHLARALRFRARRWETQRFTAADGLVLAKEHAAALMAPERLGARAYSASALALFSGCPYRFFLQAVMGVSEREQPCELDELDARQRGVLFHAVQRRFLGALAERGWLPLEPAQLDQALALLDDLLRAQVAEARERHAPAVERVFEASLLTLHADLAEWARHLAAERRWVPLRFELGFGLPPSGERDVHSQSEPVQLPGGLLLRGAIDLVERRAGAGDELVLRATDHKTGKPPDDSGAITAGGRSLQPLLYALALEQLFPGARIDSGRLYFCTGRGGFQSHEVPLDAAARARAQELVAAVDDMLAQGFLPAAPARLPGGGSECDHCSYRVICGPYEPERVARVKAADAGRLAPLHRVRSLP
jgi:CRISPR/Cas system-associated exonuclease Cas4 (RecB family)